MDWKRSLLITGLALCALAARTEEVANPEAGSVEPQSARPFSLYTSPMDPDECQLGGRRFGCDMHPKKRRMKMHSGWDLQARPPGNPNLRSIGEGVITKAGRLSPICGNGVQIQLKTGLYVYYCHMSQVEKFKAGDPVGAGQTLGRMGQSGVCAGPHLHFVMATCPEIGEKCVVDPADYLNPADVCKQALPDRTQGKRC